MQRCRQPGPISRRPERPAKLERGRGPFASLRVQRHRRQPIPALLEAVPLRPCIWQSRRCRALWPCAPSRLGGPPDDSGSVGTHMFGEASIRDAPRLETRRIGMKGWGLCTVRDNRSSALPTLAGPCTRPPGLKSRALWNRYQRRASSALCSQTTALRRRSRTATFARPA